MWAVRFYDDDSGRLRATVPLSDGQVRQIQAALKLPARPRTAVPVDYVVLAAVQLHTLHGGPAVVERLDD